MTLELGPGLLLEAATVALTHEPLPESQVVAGSPTTATLVLDERDGHEIGVWEITPGTASDFEADEVFVVLSGRARVEFVTVRTARCPGPSTSGPARSFGSRPA